MSFEHPVSPYQKVCGLVYFARMLSKIRLYAAGKLAADYVPHLGEGFDGRCLRFLHLDYDELKKRVLEGGSDQEILQWAFAHGRGHKPCDEEIEGWNSFMVKRGWRDDLAARLEFRVKESKLDRHAPKIETMFDFIEADEGRVPPENWWE